MAFDKLFMHVRRTSIILSICVATSLWSRGARACAPVEAFVIRDSPAFADTADVTDLSQTDARATLLARLDDALRDLDVREDELGTFVEVDVSDLAMTTGDVQDTADAIGDGDWRNLDEAHRSLTSLAVQRDADGRFDTVEAYLRHDAYEIVRRSAYIDEVLAPYVSHALGIASEAERVRYLAGVCGELLDYDESLYVRDVYDALLTGRGICQSYAKLMCELCGRCGIVAHLVTGEAIDVSGAREPHMWCEVVVDGVALSCDTCGADGGDARLSLGSRAEFEAMGYSFE